MARCPQFALVKSLYLISRVDWKAFDSKNNEGNAPSTFSVDDF